MKTAEVTVKALGEVRYTNSFNPCQYNITQLCPIPAGPFHAAGNITIPDQYTGQIPSIAFSVPDVHTVKILSSDDIVGRLSNAPTHWSRQQNRLLSNLANQQRQIHKFNRHNPRNSRHRRRRPCIDGHRLHRLPRRSSRRNRRPQHWLCTCSQLCRCHPMVPIRCLQRHVQR